MGCGTVFMRSGLFWPILLLISRSILRREIYKRTFTREQREVHMYVHELMVWWVWQNFDCGGHTHTPPVIRQASTCFRLSARPNLLPWTGATTNCHVAEFPHHQSSKCMRTLNRKFNVFFCFSARLVKFCYVEAGHGQNIGCLTFLTSSLTIHFI